MTVNYLKNKAKEKSWKFLQKVGQSLHQISFLRIITKTTWRAYDCLPVWGVSVTRENLSPCNHNSQAVTSFYILVVLLFEDIGNQIAQKSWAFESDSWHYEKAWYRGRQTAQSYSSIGSRKQSTKICERAQKHVSMNKRD